MTRMRKGCRDPDTFTKKELELLERWHFAKLRGQQVIDDFIEAKREEEFRRTYRKWIQDSQVNPSTPASAAPHKPPPPIPQT